MSWLKRVAYMGLGALLMVALVAGGVAVFAQDGDDAQEPEVQEDGQEAEDSVTPELREWRFRARGALQEDRNELLAEALGISVEELEAAYEEVRVAVIEQALEEGLITDEQADLLLESERPLRARRVFRNLVVNTEELLADALGVTVEELQEARSAVRAARLAELVEAGVLTQEQADLIAAKEAVAGYIDRDALAATMQNAYEEAISAALEDGAITQEQADQLLENLPNFALPGFGGFGFGGGRGHHGHGPGGWGGAFAPDAASPAIDAGLGT